MNARNISFEALYAEYRDAKYFIRKCKKVNMRPTVTSIFYVTSLNDLQFHRRDKIKITE